ncbi:hypothetical protein RchiOBHm_Chr5g0001311 [Rosa chinensis]|uniref:Uncharacterized protein n=1 Tax=Rosa chinensis TaxID=74649 RepID=A0A2P6Q281_ROSCH|nr:hypothetical protein RchiOBHm_Chr5g0001311 [Rosa chinensis]
MESVSVMRLLSILLTRLSSNLRDSMQKSLGVSFLLLLHCLLFSTISISYSYSDLGNSVLSDSLTVLDSEEEGGYHLIEAESFILSGCY